MKQEIVIKFLEKTATNDCFAVVESGEVASPLYDPRFMLLMIRQIRPPHLSYYVPPLKHCSWVIDTKTGRVHRTTSFRADRDHGFVLLDRTHKVKRAQKRYLIRQLHKTLAEQA